MATGSETHRQDVGRRIHQRQVEQARQWRADLLQAAEESGLSVAQLPGRVVNGVEHHADVIRIGRRSATTGLLLSSSARGAEACLPPVVYAHLVRVIRNLPDSVSVVIINAVTMEAPPWPMLQLRQLPPPPPTSQWSNPLLTNVERRLQEDQLQRENPPTRHPRSENPVWDEDTLQSIIRTHFGKIGQLVHVDIRMGIQQAGQLDILCNNHPESESFTQARRMFTNATCSHSLYPVYAPRGIEPIMGAASLLDTKNCVSIVAEFGAHSVPMILQGMTDTESSTPYRHRWLFDLCLSNREWLSRAQDQAISIVTDALEYLAP